MAEIAKCPMCGGTPSVLDYYGDGYEKSYICCNVEVHGRELWGQYAAAMELAKAAVNVQRKYDALKQSVVHIYNSGYHAGHHYTVEGGYADIHSSDMDTYHAEEVAELLAALVGEE